MKRLSLVLLVGLGVGALLGQRYGETSSPRSSLKMVFEVRNKIHQHYVEEVDSVRVIEAAIDGLLAALPEGENIYISPTEMAEINGGSEVPALDNRRQIGMLDEAFRHVSQQYVASVPIDTLSRGMIWGMVSSLDPHSNYLNANEYTEMIERFRGDFEGIGIYFEIRQGKLMVISPILGSPSYGKLRAGDQLVAIEGVSTEGITNEQVMKKLRGPKGSTVQVTVYRQGRKDPFEVTIHRDRIEVRSIPYVYLLRPGIGYIRIARFAENTGQELGQALRTLRDQGMTRLLLDLRGNGGGLLTQAVEVADYFLDYGELLVYTEGRSPDSRREYRARRRLTGEPLPLIVMIDHGSASASEIVAGAVQDLDMGLIVGQPSFGKGLVQEQFPLSSGGGLLLLTVARYYTPLGRLIQRSYTHDRQAYYQEVLEGFAADQTDSLQLDREVFYTAQGRPVYGGGGIVPDVSLETDQYSDFALELFNRGLLADFSSHWVGAQPVWSGNFAAFQAGYQVDDSALAAFHDFVQQAGVAITEQELADHGNFLRQELKAGMAQVLWGDEQRYRIHLEGNPQVLQALELFPQADALLSAGRSGNPSGY